MLTSLLDSSEGFNINCTIEVFDHLGQVSLHAFDRPLVGQPTDRSRWGRQYLLNP